MGFGIMQLLTEAVGIGASGSVNTRWDSRDPTWKFCCEGKWNRTRGDQRSIGVGGCGGRHGTCLFSRKCFTGDGNERAEGEKSLWVWNTLRSCDLICKHESLSALATSLSFWHTGRLHFPVSPASGWGHVISSDQWNSTSWFRSYDIPWGSWLLSLSIRQLSEYRGPRRRLQDDGGSIRWKGQPTRNIHFVCVREEKVFVLIHWDLGLL